MRIKIVKGDITTLAVDAIVNAAKIAVREVREFLAAKDAKTQRGWKLSFAASRSVM